MPQRTCSQCDRPVKARGLCNPHYMDAWREGRVSALPRWQPPTVEERFWAKVDRRAEDVCWPWLASRYSSGYGQFGSSTAHRFAYRLLVGPIPAGYEVDHLCMRRDCVNPAHLEAVTSSENTRRSYGPSVAAARMKEAARTRTHCHRGHPMTPENTYVTPSEGWRQCRECKRINAANRRTRVHR